MSKHKTKSHPKRGLALTIWLVILLLSSLLTVILVLDKVNSPEGSATPFLLAALFLAAIAKLVGVIGIWFWEKWGLYLYAGGVVLAIVAGLMLTANWLLPLNEVIPLAILGWLIRDKWEAFGLA